MSGNKVDVSCDLGKIESLAAVVGSQLENYLSVFSELHGDDSQDVTLIQGLCWIMDDIKSTAVSARKQLYGVAS